MTAAMAQPVVRPGNGVLNSASYLSPGLPASGIAQGSIFVVFGTGLGPSQIVQADKLPLPTKLAETSVTVTVGGTSKPAFLVYTLASQVAAILPSSVPTGSGTVTVTYNGATSAPAPIQVVGSAFGIYTLGASASGQAVATDPIFYIKNTVIHTFHPGDVVVLWGTGLGPIQGDDAKDSPVGNLGDIQMYVGTAAVDTIYHGRSGSPGLDQIQFHVPAGVDGCSVPVGVKAGGGMSNITTIAVSKTGQTCTDSVMGQDLIEKLASGQTVDFGYIRLESGTRLGDRAFASFSEFTPANAGLAQYGVSSGYCAAIDCSNGCVMQGTPSDMSPGQLDAGPLTVDNGAGGTIPLSRYAGSYGAVLNPNGGRFLWIDSRYSVSGRGGARVLPFATEKSFASTGSQFTNIGEFQNVPVKNDFTVAWDSSQFLVKDGTASINGVSFSNGYGLAVYFQCTAPVAAGQFTIPSWVLSALPPSGMEQNGNPLGYIWIGQYAPPATFNATGLDKGLFTDITFFLRTLKFQ
jgi:uncharacterized protein (TIGR03437 family)